VSKRTITGVVSSDKMDKTIVVQRTTRETHPLYGKKFTVNAKFHAHDEKNSAKIGDKVVIEESVPFSRTVKWNLREIVEKGREKLEIKKTEVEEEIEEHAKKEDQE
jgi:small subunit ribosomal protein S17